jgi:putative membrane protein
LKIRRRRTNVRCVTLRAAGGEYEIRVSPRCAAEESKTFHTVVAILRSKSTQMTSEIFLRYLHFISIFTIAGTLISEHLFLKKEMSRKELTRIARIDAMYGLAALTLLAAGLTLWLTGAGKPAVYYTKNWIFHVKISLFLCIGLLSIYPTVFFLRSRKGNPDEIIAVPKNVFTMLRLELALLFIIPLLAGLMARGIGFFG